MEIVYEIERKDLVAGQWYLFWHGAASRRTHSIMFGLFILVATLYSMQNPRWTLITRLNVFVEVLLSLLIIAGILTFLVNSYVFRKSIPKRRHNGMLGSHKLTLTPKGLWEVTSANESLSYWHGIDRVEENEDYIFIFTTPINTHIIPRKIFKNREEGERFYELAKQYHHDSKLSPVLNPALS